MKVLQLSFALFISRIYALALERRNSSKELELHAERMLSGKHTISEIAMLVGMGSLGNFRQCFREEFGTTPSLYLRDKRGEEQ